MLCSGSFCGVLSPPLLFHSFAWQNFLSCISNRYWESLAVEQEKQTFQPCSLCCFQGMLGDLKGIRLVLAEAFYSMGNTQLLWSLADGLASPQSLQVAGLLVASWTRECWGCCSQDVLAGPVPWSFKDSASSAPASPTAPAWGLA